MHVAHELSFSFDALEVTLTPLKTKIFHHIETRKLIYRTNQLTGFYMMGTMVFYGSARLFSQLMFTCSKSTIATLEKGVKYVQS